MLQPDSQGYISFSQSRTAFYPLFLRALTAAGFNLVEITYVQAALFHIALVVLLLALLRSGLPRFLVLIFAIAIGCNTGFSSYHWVILTESLFFSVSAVAIASLLDYFRTGRVGFLAAASLWVGVLYGIRPAAITLMPMLVIAAWLMWRRRNAPAVVMVLALAVPLAVGPVAESLAFRAEHGDHRATVVPYMMLGKAAMLIEPNVKYSGPHADELNRLGQQLDLIYAPVHQFISGIPSLIALPIISSTYEGVAQFSILNDELKAASARTGASTDALRDDLGLQTIRQNIGGYLRLSLLNYFGQWSVAALTFPPASRSLNSYVDRYPHVPLSEHLSDVTLRPPASRSSLVVYPFFLIAGVVSLLLSVALVLFLLAPRLRKGRHANALVVAAFFSGMCQLHTVVIAFINVPTPRFLMAVYPQILLMFMFIVMALFPRLASAEAADRLDVVDQ